MTDKKLGNNQENTTLNSETKADERHPYTPPLVLSAERLEAVAAACEPAAPPFGKTVPIPCGTLGSWM